MKPHQNPEADPPCPFRTADQALAFWYGRVNYEQRSPGPTDLKLERMQALLEGLGNPQDQLRLVHVAGSKGKGSTSAMLASVLGQAGYRTGLFTSPHLARVEERIRIDGQPISAAALTARLGEIAPAVEALDSAHGPVTFFEVATALGFLHFARSGVDAAVIEVGLGGRFDSTNVCRPLVALITSISLDHTIQLGDRLAQIAMEKAGIVKPGRPALSGARGSEARPVIEQICRERQAPLRQLGVEIRYRYEPGRWEKDAVRPPRVAVTTDRTAWPVMELGLWGDHQAANAALAVAAVEHLRDEGFRIEEKAVADGLARVQWPARLEVTNRQPLVLLDCAHNVASAEALVETLHSSFPGFTGPGRRFLVFAGSNDKDLAGMLRVLAPRFDRVFLTQLKNSLRRVPPEELARLLHQIRELPLSTHAAADEAWRAARKAAGPDDLICVTGSVYLAGELRPLLLASS